MNYLVNGRSYILGLLFGLMTVFSGCTVVETHSRFTEKKDEDKNIEYRVKAAFLHLQRGHTEPAKLKATEVLEIRPNHAPAMAALALALDKEGEPGEAEKYYKGAIKSDPKYTRGKELYGVFLYTKGRYEEALAQFELVVNDKLYENLAAANMNLGLCALRMNKTERAEAAFEKSVVINPKQTKPYIHLARINYEKEDYRFAARYFRNYEKNLGSVNNYTPRTLALGYRIQKGANRNELATRYVQLLEKLYPNSQEYSEILKLNAFQNSGSL
jgi:type IV pilus assembly protein PilF